MKEPAKKSKFILNIITNCSFWTDSCLVPPPVQAVTAHQLHTCGHQYTSYIHVAILFFFFYLMVSSSTNTAEEVKTSLE